MIASVEIPSGYGVVRLVEHANRQCAVASIWSAAAGPGIRDLSGCSFSPEKNVTTCSDVCIEESESGEKTVRWADATLATSLGRIAKKSDMPLRAEICSCI